MAKIKQLTQEVIAKIAAGEVVERPAFAVKELLENAIDAGSTKIDIGIWESGLKKITVFDNGKGISKDDVAVSVLVHTTSKIFEEEDLVGISTLGFRGEALSSIAAISTLTLESRINNASSGTYVKVRFGKIEKTGSIGIPVGTRVTVENLFGNVPARKKFLKTLRTEFRHILDVVIAACLAYPNIAFQLTHNGKTILKVAATKDYPDRMHSLLGSSAVGNFIPLSFQEGYVSIKGYIGHPQAASSSTHKLYVFVNNRKIQNYLIASSAKDAYANLLDHNSYPTGVLFISMPYEAVDVNVHPRKEEVAFTQPQVIYSSVGTAIKETLSSHNLTFFNVSWQGLTNSSAGKLLKEEVMKTDAADIGKTKGKGDIIQIHNTFLLTESKRGVLLIDQHAAHEAMLYREFVNAFEKKKTESGVLNPPFVALFSLSDFEAVMEYKDIFKSLGFDFEEFGENTVRFNRVPSLFVDRDIKEVVEEMIVDLKQEKNPRSIDTKSKKMLSTLACKNAIKAGNTLTKEQARKLITNLKPEDMLYTCPHGRPVKIDIPLSTLARWMKRH